jgi:hypothetical protein
MKGIGKGRSLQKWLRRSIALLLCAFLILGDSSIGYATEVIINAGENWNTYLGRVYTARKAEFDELQQKNAGNDVAVEDVWTGNSVQTTRDDDGDGLLDIYTAAELRWALINKKSLELMCDIDLGGRNGVKWSPVSDPGNITIEGNGYTIYNMYVDAGNQAGFIAATARSTTSGFKMQNLRFRYCNVQSSGKYVGTVVGYIGGGTFTKVSVEDSVVVGSQHIGGIGSGWNNDGDGNLSSFYAYFDQCHVRNVTTYGKNTGTTCVGSFLGPFSGCKVTNCYSIDSYDISAGSHSGGFISCPGNSVVENCFTNVKLYCNSDGGVFYGIGHLKNRFTNCFSAGVVEGTKSVGGFFGRDEKTADELTNCYSTSMVGMQNSASYMGGFCGKLDVATVMKNCFSAGEVGTTQTVPSNDNIVDMAVK